MINGNLIQTKEVVDDVDNLAELAYENNAIDDAFSKIIYAVGKFFCCSNLFGVRDSLADRQKIYLITERKASNQEAIRNIAEQLIGNVAADALIGKPDIYNKFLSLFTDSDLSKIQNGIVEIEVDLDELEEFKKTVKIMRHAILGKKSKVKDLLELANLDPILAKSELIQDIITLHQAFQGKTPSQILDNAQFNQLFDLYKRNQSAILNIKNADLDQISEISDELKSEVVYNSLIELVKENFVDLGLGDGPFKTYMNKLVAILSSPSEGIHILSSSSSEVEDESNFLAFENFVVELEKPENKEAAAAFKVCAELLQLNLDQQFSKSISRYVKTEQDILSAIEALSEPLRNLEKNKDDLPTINLVLNQIALKMEKDPCFQMDSLKKLLVEKTDAASAYIYLKSLRSPNQDLVQAIYNMKRLLGVSGKERISFLVKMGEGVIKNPELAYLKLENGILKLSIEPLASSAESEKVNQYLMDVVDRLDSKSYSKEELLNLEAFTSMALYTQITSKKVDAHSQSIIHTLTKLQSKIADKISETDLSKLRASDEYQYFCRFMKKTIENSSGYTRNFWVDAKAAEKLKFSDRILQIVGNKIADSTISLKDSLQLLHSNDKLGYEIYEYPSSGEEKKKILLFVTGQTSWAFFQGIDHQLGLLGDPTILAKSMEILSDISSNMILEGYKENFKNGEVELITAGFGNSGAAAAIIGSKIAASNTNLQVRSISAGSTPVVTTEDAHTISRIENFFPIRLKYESDLLVDRTQALGDFSDDLYHTFPLTVRHASSLIDHNCHNQMEYGNKENFGPAMTNPIHLHNIYRQVSSQILPNAHEKMPEGIQKLLSGNVKKEVESIDLSGSLVLQLKAKVTEAESARSSWLDWLLWRNKSATKEIVVSSENAENQVLIHQCKDVKDVSSTIHDLQEAVAQLKNPVFSDALSAEDAISLLFIVDHQLINTEQINRAVGKNPQMIDLLSELRTLVIQKLKSLPEEVSKKLLENNLVNFKTMAASVESSDIAKNFIKRKDILQKIEFEDCFLEFIGSKIGLQGNGRGGIDKIGSDAYVNKLHTDGENFYDISLYTPTTKGKKQKIVISCNGLDKLGAHNLLNGKFNGGDVEIIQRADLLKGIIDKKLRETLFSGGNLKPSDVEIVCIGFGTEGSVATALGCLLAEDAEPSCQIQSIGFGAPPFLVEGEQERFKNKANFIPLRFVGVGDTWCDWRALTLGTYTLTDGTFYTIPMQFRALGVAEKLKQHTPDLYGDVQNIKSAMQTVHLMQQIAHEKKAISKKSEESLVVQNPKWITIDVRDNLLKELSQKSVEDLKKEQPGKIIQTMKYCVELTESDALSTKQKAMIKDFFGHFVEAIKCRDIREEITPTSNPFCQRMFNFGYQPLQLFSGKLNLQRIISPDLDKAMKNLEYADKNLPQKQLDELVLTRDFYRGLLAGDLNGNRYKAAGAGVNGAVFFKHLESRSKFLFPDEEAYRPFLGVFKPHPKAMRARKGLFDYSQWIERGKSFGGMAALLNKKGNGNQGDTDRRVNNEIFAYELYHIFGFENYIGFPTTLKFPDKTDAENRPGSFCSFIPGLDTVEKHVRKVHGKDQGSNLLDDPKRKYSEDELLNWQMSKIFDFLTGNLDGHEGNAFVEVEDGELIGTTNFDYDKAFTHINQDGKIPNQYKWAHLEISKKPLTLDTKEVLNELFNDPENLITSFLKLARHDGRNCFSENQEKLLRLRIQIIQKLATTEGARLSDFLNWRTDHDFARLQENKLELI